MNNKKLPVVLVFADWFEPGIKAGGPIRSVVNFARQLEDDLDIFVFTSDRDMGELQPYEEIETDRWIQNGRAKVFYATPGFLSWKNIKGIIKELKPDFIYLNSMFSKYFSIVPLLLLRFGNTSARCILAPRGMLRESALSHKSRKKVVFLRLFRLLKLETVTSFQATDLTEENDIRINFPYNAGIVPIANLPGKLPAYMPPPLKRKGHLKMIFVGRAHPIKNPLWLLDCLMEVGDEIEFTMVVSGDDDVYWDECLNKIKSLPANINVKVIEQIPNNELHELLKAIHVFILPTRGENFGHAIFESLSTGRPVIISDQTPWKNLPSVMAGFDLPLYNKGAFQEAVRKFAAMDDEELGSWCRGAYAYCKDKINPMEIRGHYLKAFSL